MRIRLAIALLVLLAGGSTFAQPSTGQQAVPAPQLAPGLTLRYQLDIRTTHDATVSGAVENPQGGQRLSVRFGAVLKLEAIEPVAGEAQVRATVEQVSVVIGGDTFDPTVAALEHRYEQLEGFTTTFAPTRLQPPAPDTPDASVSAEGWLLALISRLASGPGESAASASREQPVDSAPLKGTVLRIESSYLRDEPCGGQGERAATAAASLAGEPCAVILTHSTLMQTSSQRDRTPPDYRERGLHTSGRWEGTGESLAYVARRTGWVVSITESQTEQMDFTITREDGEVVHRQRGSVETQTNLLLQSVESRKQNSELNPSCLSDRLRLAGAPGW